MPSKTHAVYLAEAEMTIYNAAEMKNRLLLALAESSTALELDLSPVQELDSAGLQVLLLLKREAAAAGKTLYLSRHSPAVLDVLDLCGLAAFFGDPLLIENTDDARSAA